MRIIKDVIIAEAIEPVWAQVVAGGWPIMATAGRSEKGPAPVEMFEMNPPTRLSYRSVVAGSPVVTTIDLSRKGKRTSLRVTVTGWEEVGPERAKIEMPKISLGWERVLAALKESIESPPD